MGVRNPETQFIRNCYSPDLVKDRMFQPQCKQGGAAYAPYLYNVTLGNGVAFIRYMLLRWNRNRWS
jgi:hypothetical protein